MKNNYPAYDPENIESLLQHKSFEELTNSEKEFVLQHISSPQEYEEMRGFLGNIKTSFSVETEIEPDTGIKNQLMEQFHKTYTRPKTSPLSGLIDRLFPSGKSFFLSPGFQIAGIAVLIVSAVFMINRQNSLVQDNLAIHHKNTEERQAPAEAEHSPEEPMYNTATGNELNAEEQSKGALTPSSDEKKLFELPVTAAAIEENSLARTDITDDQISSVSMDSSVYSQQQYKTERSSPLKTEAEGNSSTAYSSSEIANDLDRVELMESAAEKTKSTNSKSKKSDLQSGAASQTLSDKSVSFEKEEKANKKEVSGKSAAAQPELLDLLFTSL